MRQRALAAGLAVAACLLGPAAARIHALTIQNDPRRVFSIEPFGFLQGGQLEMTVSGLSSTPAGPHRMGFVCLPVTTEGEVGAYIAELQRTSICALDLELAAAVLDLSNWCVRLGDAPGKMRQQGMQASLGSHRSCVCVMASDPCARIGWW
jgi:hypothetical protein